MMRSILFALAAVPLAFARQVPVVDGVIGGVPVLPRTPHVDAASLAKPAATTPGKLRIVENSGVCETTAGVYQASGYADLTSSESLWYVVDDQLATCFAEQCVSRFWFFAARNNPDTAPVAVWLNGGVSQDDQYT